MAVLIGVGEGSEESGFSSLVTSVSSCPKAKSHRLVPS